MYLLQYNHKCQTTFVTSVTVILQHIKIVTIQWKKDWCGWKFVIKGIKNGCPCIVEIRGTHGCALVGDPARAVGECRDVAKAQP